MRVCFLLACTAAKMIPITNIPGISFVSKSLPITHAIRSLDNFSGGKTVFSTHVLKKRVLPVVPSSFPYFMGAYYRCLLIFVNSGPIFL